MATMALPARPQRMGREEIYRARYIIAFAVVSASVLELVDTSIVNVALPHMMGNLGATLDEIAWVSTGYIVANVIMLPLTSWFGERFGRRNYYTASVALFTLASFFCAEARTLESLVLWRIVQGLGGGALISTAQAILFDVFPREELGKAMAIFGMGVMVGPTLGPTLGGWITDNYSWPWIFYVNIPLGIMAALMTWRYVPEPEHVSQRSNSIDWIGLGLLIAGIGALQVLLERGESRDWFASKEIVTEMVLAVAGLVLFVWHELRTPHPIVNLRVLKDRQLAAGVTFGVLLGFAVYASVFALPIFLQSLLGYSAWDTGKVILPGAIASAVAMAMMAKLSGKVDARILIIFGVSLFAISMWMHGHLTTEIGTQDLFWPMILRGTGLGFVFVPLTGVAIASLKPQDIAQGTGLYNLSRQLGGSFGIAITATLITRFREQGREALLPHLAANEPTVRSFMDAAVQRMMRLGGTMADAQLKAARLLELKVDAQAAMLAYEKIFLIMGVSFLCALPLLLLIRTGKTKAGGVAH